MFYGCGVAVIGNEFADFVARLGNATAVDKVYFKDFTYASPGDAVREAILIQLAA